MILVERVVGRLVEARAVSAFTIEGIAAFGGRLGQILGEVKGRIVACIDLRSATLASPEQSDMVLAMFRRDNPLLERSAILLADGQAMLGMQVERLVRESANPARKTFRDIDALYAYLDEVLSREERSRLRVFLANPGARPTA